jgi:hypothetical protein
MTTRFFAVFNHHMGSGVVLVEPSPEPERLEVKAKFDRVGPWSQKVGPTEG